jgi:hypothetical protein
VFGSLAMSPSALGRDADAGREPAAAELTKLDEVPTF